MQQTRDRNRSDRQPAPRHLVNSARRQPVQQLDRPFRPLLRKIETPRPVHVVIAIPERQRVCRLRSRSRIDRQLPLELSDYVWSTLDQLPEYVPYGLFEPVQIHLDAALSR